MSPFVETRGRAASGMPVLLAGIALFLCAALFFILIGVSVWFLVPAVVLLIAAPVMLGGLYTLQPNQAAVLSLFGDYRGTDRSPGLRFANIFYRKTRVSLRTRNFTTATSKVNDANGSPIMIAAVVVWRVTDTAKAVFEVDDFRGYVRIQSESAIRHLARSFPYDAFDDDNAVTLIGDTSQVNHELMLELQARAAAAGVDILEARITDLSYAPEIAEVMLRRQQAAAIVAARAKIVEGAIGMVRDAVTVLEEGNEDGADAIPLSRERRASFISNLMTVIASDQPATPVVNVGASD